MSVIALTGNFASGKSAVLGLLAKKGAVVFDADAKIHSYYRNKKSPVYKKVAAVFPGCLKAGSISRKALGAVVFSDSSELKKLEAIVHPAVIKDLLSWIKRGKAEKKIYIAEIPLLFEKKLTRRFKRTILIKAAQPVLIQRIIKKYGISRKAAMDRLSLCRPIRQKIEESDFVIDNSLDFKGLKKEVDLLWKKIKQN